MAKKIRFISFFIMLLSWMFPQVLRAETNYTIMGKVVGLAREGHNFIFNCENGKVRVSILKDDLVRVHMAPAGKEFPADDLHLQENGPYFVVNYTWPGVICDVKEEFDYDMESEVYAIKAGKLVVKARKNPFKLAFYDTEGKLLAMEKAWIVNAGMGQAGSKVYETMAMGDDEHFFGFGAHNHPLDMRGRKIVCSAKELEDNRETGGFPVPFFYSSKGYGIFFNNLDDDVTFEMGTTDSEYGFSGTSGGMEGWDMDYYFIYGPKFEDILDGYTDIVGKPILPEKWLFGHIQHHCCSWTADSVIEAAQKYGDGGWPCDVLIMDHQALRKGLEWDTEKGYANYKQMYESIDKLGFKTAFSCALFDDIYDWQQYDPTNSGQVNNYWKLHEGRVIDGMDFWRQDNSERSMQYTGKNYLSNGYKAHELFGSLWAKNVVEGMESMGLYGRPVISRGGPIGGHRYIIPWAGDMPFGVEFEGVDLSYIRNGGLAGYSSISVDLGGFTNRGKNDPLDEYNIIRRVINMSLFVPISKFQGDGDDGAKLPWLYSESQQELFRYYMKLRYRLLPYRYSAAIEASLTGRPVLAPLVFDHQNDENTYNKDFEFLMGRNILVAPVIDKSEKWEVYLPAGKWIHYWTGTEYNGPKTVTVDAPLYGTGGLPMFVKAGSIIPMMPEMSYIYQKKADPITLDVYPEMNGSIKYAMYDCKSVKKPVQIEKTEFTCDQQGKNIRISISPSSVAYELWVHSAVEATSVSVDGKKLKDLQAKAEYDKSKTGWYYGSGCFYGSDEIKTINIKAGTSSKERVIEIALSKDMAEQENMTADIKAVERQITFEPRGHYLDNMRNFSPDDKWLAYDTRTEPPAIAENTNIEMVNVESGKVVVLYETTNASKYGPGVATVDFHPFENKVLFIHGLRNCNSERPYSYWRRTCAAAELRLPVECHFIDARDVTVPFTPGALRGGTHAHEWSGDGKWIGFTYNDDITADSDEKAGKKANMRTVGVSKNLRPVKVDKDAAGENNDGEWFSVLVAKVTSNPKPGSDEISRAFSDAWVGTKGY
ncbi:MAG: DUF3748 domain-containing protein, partial [Candidatus Brocadiia bacterium]